MQKGDLVICNDLIGFVIKIKALTVLLNTPIGLKEVSLNANSAVMATSAEIAQSYSNQLAKVVFNN